MSRNNDLYETYIRMRMGETPNSEEVADQNLKEENDGPPVLPLLPPVGPMVGGPGQGLFYPALLYWYLYSATKGGKQEVDGYFQDAENLTNTTPNQWSTDDVRTVGFRDIQGPNF